MKPLKQLQSDFQSYLLKGQEELMKNEVVNCEPMTASRRLAVYYEGYRLRLIEALQVDYPKIEVLLGEENFQLCCLAYIESYPSHHFSLRPFGRNFADFLKDSAPYANYPFLAEMADFEWALKESLDTSDGPVLNAQALSQVPPEQWGYILFQWHSSVHTRTYSWDTPSLWDDIQQEKPKREPIALASPQAWIFWRKQLKSMYESMNSIQTKLATAISQQASFADMAEILCDQHSPEEVPQILLQHIHYWLDQGLISSIKLINVD